MTERKPMSPSLRFAVLERDNFTCQYCGAKSPDVKLEIDHKIPVAAGGTNDAGNLVTACFACNRGKAASVLGDDEFVRRKTARDAALQNRITLIVPSDVAVLLDGVKQRLYWNRSRTYMLNELIRIGLESWEQTVKAQ